MEMFYFAIFAIISVACSWRFQPAQAFISLLLTIFFDLTGGWYVDIVLYTWFFFIFTSDIGIVSIAAFTMGYKHERKKFKDKDG